MSLSTAFFLLACGSVPKRYDFERSPSLNGNEQMILMSFSNLARFSRQSAALTLRQRMLNFAHNFEYFVMVEVGTQLK